MIAFARFSESVNSNSSRERNAKVSFSSKRPPMAVVEAASQSTCTEEIDEKRNEYARPVTSTYITALKRATASSERGRVIVSLAEPFHGQQVENMVRGARGNAKPREPRQERRTTSLYRFYYRRVFRGTEVVDCAVRRGS